MAQLRPSPCRPELMLNMRTTERVAWLEIAWDDPWWAGALLWWRDSTDWLTEATRSQCCEQGPWSVSTVCGTPCPCWMLWKVALVHLWGDQKRCLILISQDGPLKMQYGRRCGWLVSAKRKCGNQQGQSAQLSVVARVSSYRVLIIVECNKFQKTQTLWFVRWTTEGARSFYTYWLADSLTDGSVRLLKRIRKKKDDLSTIVYTRPRIYN